MHGCGPPRTRFGPFRRFGRCIAVLRRCLLVSRDGVSAFWLHVSALNVWAAGRCPRGLLRRFRASSGLSGLSGRHFSLFARFRAEEAPCAAQRPGLKCSAALGSGIVGLRCVDARSNAALLGTSHFTEIWVPGPPTRITPGMY